VDAIAVYCAKNVDFCVSGMNCLKCTTDYKFNQTFV
jgi:hypothetical protein